MVTNSNLHSRLLSLLGKFALPLILACIAIPLCISGVRAVNATRDGEAWARSHLTEALKPWQAEFKNDWEAICRSPLLLNNPKK